MRGDITQLSLEMILDKPITVAQSTLLVSLLVPLKPCFRGTKMVRGWRNRQQISTRSVNESPWPLTNPINIHASWVGLRVDMGFTSTCSRQFQCHEQVVTYLNY